MFIYISIGLNFLSVVFLVVLICRKTDTSAITKAVDNAINEMKTDITCSVKNLGESNMYAVRNISSVLSETQKNTSEAQNKKIASDMDTLRTTLQLQIRQFEISTTEQIKNLAENNVAQIAVMDSKLGKDQKQLNESVNQLLNQMQRSIAVEMNQMTDHMNAQLKEIKESVQIMEQANEKKLEEIRGTVDEKLQTTLEKRIAESFKSVSEQLKQVYQGLGEMKNLATDVGGLKKVLSGVKTRGILGEIQLGAIIEDILTRDQYDTNVATVPESSERVEFAVKLPGTEEKSIYLPIDSKLPGDRYLQLVDAQQNGTKEEIEAAYRALETVIKSEAKDIREKYIEVPYTTSFAVMFLPWEGLYCEVVNRGLIDVLRRDYHVNIAGPSTMAAFLNSLQMGFKTLAIQKRSSEVWEVLGSVKSEFEKFECVMKSMQRHLNQTSSDLNDLLGTRTRAINRKLNGVQMLDDVNAS